MELLADRFFKSNSAWIDAASGAEVRILLEKASELDAFDWEEQCARLARTRHPLLNPLLDYGDAASGVRFEAYARLPPLSAGNLSTVRPHAAEFLRTSGISLEGARANAALRRIEPEATFGIRPLGVTLQPRSALAAIQEILDAPSAASTVATIIGPTAAGLRTLRSFVARSARLSGFIPVSSAVLVNRFADSAALERHLCVLDDECADAAAFAGSLVKLAAASARPHVVIRFRRLRGGRGGIELDPLSVRSLMGMVFATPAEGPSEQELFDAARLAEGRPGAFLAQLMAASPWGTSSRFRVHESTESYVVSKVDTPPTVPPPKGRTLQTALKATHRAGALVLKGRHAAAERLLLRAARVLEGRGRAPDAAACLIRVATIALERGRASEAANLFERAQTIAGAGSVALSAAVGLGDAWIDELRLVEAEAVLRAAVAAAETLSDHQIQVAAISRLVCCLNIQERHLDAIATAAACEWTENDEAAVGLLSNLARAHSALGRTATAIRLARRAQTVAESSKDPSAKCIAGLALAEVLAAAGDARGMADVLADVRGESRRVHLPLAATEARLILCEHSTSQDSRRSHQCGKQLRSLLRLPLPRLHLHRVKAAIAKLEAPERIAFETGPREILETLLRASHDAQDDRAAVSAICSAVLQRVGCATLVVVSRTDRRVIVTEGRPWISSTSIVGRTFATGEGCASDEAVEPREAAEPVRHGSEVIAVIACRWSAGVAAERTAAAAILRAAALAAAAPVRALVDATPPPPPPAVWGDLLGTSPAAEHLREAVVRAARAPFPVLVEGESGCGKELVARAIHKLSVRRDRRFCAVNCAALTDELVEAELFGHSRGAFTGAASERAGLFEEADGGTLFLDEVAELSARAQAKLLRVLQEGEVRRVGENFSRRVDVRIVAATNRQLADEMAAGRFRADLRFRLDVVRIVVPPLRERPGDVPALAVHFWTDASQRVGSRATLTSETVAALARYDWPGNVRELQNVIAWMAVHSPRRGRVGPSALPAHVAQCPTPALRSFAAAREEFERRFVRAALAQADGQMARAARVLGISRQGLSKMIRRLKVETP